MPRSHAKGSSETKILRVELRDIGTIAYIRAIPDDTSDYRVTSTRVYRTRAFGRSTSSASKVKNGKIISVTRCKTEVFLLDVKTKKIIGHKALEAVPWPEGLSTSSSSAKSYYIFDDSSAVKWIDSLWLSLKK